MTTKYFSECALLLTERWGSLSAPLYAVGATSKEIGCFAQCVKNPDAVFMFETKKQMHSLAVAALSLPHYTMSEMEAAMSDPTLQTSITWPMLLEAYEREFADGSTSRVLQAPSKQWIRTLLRGEAGNIGQKYPRLCVVFHKLHSSLRTDNPSPTPARGAENAPKTAISIHPYRNGVVLMLLLCVFGLSANAQVQPKPGRWVSAHIIHAGSVTDTIRQLIEVSHWYPKCLDCDSMTVITHIETGRTGTWAVVKGVTYNNYQPVEWREGAWWYPVASQGQRIEVELLFEPVANVKP